MVNGKMIMTAIAVALTVLTGCRQVRYVETEHIITMRDTVDRLVERSDTFHTRDSFIMKVKGDTIYIREVQTRDRIRVSHDTLYKTVYRDSIRVEQVPVEVEKKLGKADSIFLCWGKWSLLLLCLALAAFAVYRWIFR